MNRSRSRWLRAWPRRKRLTVDVILAALAFLGPGCASLHVTGPQQDAVIRASSPEEMKGIKVVEGASPQAVAQLPPAPETPPAPATEAGPPVVPVSLDTVFRLAEEQNPQIGLARERVNEAYADKRIAASRWLPELYVGTAYYRHDGGIQAFEGPLIRSSTGAMFAGAEINGQLDLRAYAYQKVNAGRAVWQQKGELSRVTSETLLETSNAYLDLLTALSGEAIARAMIRDLEDLHRRADALASKEPAARLQVISIQAELGERRQALAKLHQQQVAAAAKLAYLLGIDPCSDVRPVDQKVMPIELVDASAPACELVQQALTRGPGIQELEGLLGLVHEAMAQAQGTGRYVPQVGLRLAEGGFGAGPGDQMTWANRFDLGLQARWNLTEYVTLRERRRAAQAKMQQAHLAYLDLRNKLAAGVQEARAAILDGREQIALGEEQIRDTLRAHDLSEERLKNSDPRDLGRSYTEVLFAIRAVAGARLNYLLALSAYDKAQVRLLVLLGPAAANRSTPKHDCP